MEPHATPEDIVSELIGLLQCFCGQEHENDVFSLSIEKKKFILKGDAVHTGNATVTWQSYLNHIFIWREENCSNRSWLQVCQECLDSVMAEIKKQRETDEVEERKLKMEELRITFNVTMDSYISVDERGNITENFYGLSGVVGRIREKLENGDVFTVHFLEDQE